MNMPLWMSNVLQEIQNPQCCLAVRVFIIKIVLNRPEYFEKYCEIWFDVLLDYCCLESKLSGGKGFHYFLRDVCTTLIDWCAKKPNIVHKDIIAERK